MRRSFGELADVQADAPLASCSSGLADLQPPAPLASVSCSSYWSLGCPRLGKRPHERPQPFALLDRLGSPVAIPEVSVLGTAWRTGAQPAMQAHSARTFLTPRNRNWRKPRAC